MSHIKHFFQKKKKKKIYQKQQKIDKDQFRPPQQDF
jgi:hypothetical protein